MTATDIEYDLRGVKVGDYIALLSRSTHERPGEMVFNRLVRCSAVTDKYLYHGEGRTKFNRLHRAASCKARVPTADDLRIVHERKKKQSERGAEWNRRRESEPYQLARRIVGDGDGGRFERIPIERLRQMAEWVEEANRSPSHDAS